MDKYQLPPGKDNRWEATWNGQLYDYENRPPICTVVVTEQTAHLARQRACTLLRVAPEHIDIKLLEERGEARRAEADSNHVLVGRDQPGEVRKPTTRKGRRRT